VTYDVHTANVTANAANDYVAKSLAAETIPAGQTSRTFTVTLNGDTTVETNESFNVVLSDTSGASAYDAVALGTLVNDDGPTLSVGDASVAEGDAGTRTITFPVTLSTPAAVPVTYGITTADAGAVAPADYQAKSLVGETIPAGQQGRTFSVVVNGDTAIEPNEAFQVKLSAPTGATIFDPAALGTVLNDDGPALSIANASIAEGNSGTRSLVFTVTLAHPAAVPVT
jgi:hypothetical protein